MKQELHYSENGLVNRLLFLSKSNEINIIVEDDGREYEYEQIFDRLFKGEITINHIFPMNGKPGVIKAFNNFGTQFQNKQVFYIVDGDFDLIMNKKEINNPNFIYLNNYNIEDYYIDKKAILKFVSGKIKKTMSESETLVDFERWENDSFSKLIDLFICFMIIQKVDPTHKNVNENSEYFYLNPATGFFSQNIITNYIEDTKMRYSKYDELKTQFLSDFNTVLNSDPYRIICGKYLLAGLAQYLRIKASIKNIKYEDFKYFLINTFDIKKLDYVKEQIMDNIKKSA